MLTDQLRCLVVVLVLDLLGFCAEKRADHLGNYFVALVCRACRHLPDLPHRRRLQDPRILGRCGVAHKGTDSALRLVTCWSSDALRLSSSDPTGRKSRALSIVVAEYRREVRKLPYSGNRAGRRLRSRDSEAHRRKTRAAAEQGSGYNLSASAYGTTTAVCS